MKQRTSVHSDAGILARKSKLLPSVLIGLLILITGIALSISNKRKKDTEFAYKETRKALAFLTLNFNRGVEKMAYLEEFECAKKKIYNY
nr:hypothetical protein [uncultured Allomuricauda sp.]